MLQLLTLPKPPAATPTPLQHSSPILPGERADCAALYQLFAARGWDSRNPNVCSCPVCAAHVVRLMAPRHPQQLVFPASFRVLHNVSRSMATNGAWREREAGVLGASPLGAI